MQFHEYGHWDRLFISQQVPGLCDIKFLLEGLVNGAMGAVVENCYEEDSKPLALPQSAHTTTLVPLLQMELFPLHL